jgi:ubiquinone/menaquinone biosynthesis C-methylase UbiE
MNSAWYEEWFNQDYLSLYAHRNQSEADSQIAFLFEQGLLKPEDVVLDSACGAGRHVVALAQRVRSTYGIDLSEDLLREAQTRVDETRAPSVSLFHGDMRCVPLKDASVDIVLSMFTSFGYFETDVEHINLLKEWNRLLKTDGRLIIDYLNRPHVLDTLENAETDSVNNVNGHTIAQQRMLSEDTLRIEKRIEFTNGDSENNRVFLESVRMYDLNELSKLLGEAGFRITHLFGDFMGSAYSPTTDRLIVAVMKESTCGK